MQGGNHNKARGDGHFKGQHKQADEVDDEGEKVFYSMIVRIAEGMHAGGRDPLGNRRSCAKRMPRHQESQLSPPFRVP